MRTILGIALGAFLFLAACNKDEGKNDCQKLEGKWTASSWLEDNEQFFGDTIYITSSILDFKKLDGDQGDLTWDITYTIGGTENIIGSYKVNAACDELVITPKSGTGTTYSFTIDGDQLTLDSDDNNVHVVQVYNRD